MAAKFYAVRKGKKPGIYMSWDICKQQTDGFPGAEFKSFPTREAAEEYIGQKQQTVEKDVYKRQMHILLKEDIVRQLYHR